MIQADDLQEESQSTLDKCTVRLLPVRRSKPAHKYRILQFLSGVGYPVGAYEIAQNLGISSGSVRARLSELQDKGLISRLCYGKYLITPTYGVGVHPGSQRVQNLLVVAAGVPVRESDQVSLAFWDLVSLTVTFGVKRGKISYRVGAPVGLDPSSLALVHHIVLREVEARGYRVGPEAWAVRNVEFLSDYSGFRLEGLESVTILGLVGELEKYYNKPRVRHEKRASPRSGVGLQALRALMSEGADVGGLHRRLERVENELRKNTEANKGLTRQVYESRRISQALFDRYTESRACRGGV